MRNADSAPDMIVSPATNHMAACRPSVSAMMPAPSAPMAETGVREIKVKAEVKWTKPAHSMLKRPPSGTTPARSIMGEALLNLWGRGPFQAFGAGRHPETGYIVGAGGAVTIVRASAR